MPIRWSALRLSQYLDNIEELQAEAERYLEPALIFAESAKDIDNLPEYMQQRLIRLISEIKRALNLKEKINIVRKNIPTGVVEAEREHIKQGVQQGLSCRCGEEMRFLCDDKKTEVWVCSSCDRLLERLKNSDIQSWYVPEENNERR